MTKAVHGAYVTLGATRQDLRDHTGAEGGGEASIAVRSPVLKNSRRAVERSGTRLSRQVLCTTIVRAAGVMQRGSAGIGISRASKPRGDEKCARFGPHTTVHRIFDGMVGKELTLRLRDE